MTKRQSTNNNIAAWNSQLNSLILSEGNEGVSTIDPKLNIMDLDGGAGGDTSGNF